MKIFSFYKRDERFQHQDKILELWKLSWKISGFDPVVLGEDDASKHHLYEEMIYKIKKIHPLIMGGRNISDYGINCYIRWLAYSNQSEQYFYVSDYDVMSVGFEPINPEGGLHFMDDCCPCFVSGTPSLFNSLSISFIKETENSLERLSKLKIYKKFSHYHDQDFIQLHSDNRWNKDNDNFNKKYEIKKSRNLNMEPTSFYTNEMQKLIHFSHHYVERYFENTNAKKSVGLTEMDRIEVIEEVLSNYLSSH